MHTEHCTQIYVYAAQCIYVQDSVEPAFIQYSETLTTSVDTSMQFSVHQHFTVCLVLQYVQ
jgi:hypothetical protein